MGITRSTLLNDIAQDLEDFGEFVTTDGGFLDRQLTKAQVDVSNAKNWSWKIGSGTVATTDQNQGPYDFPADFDGFFPEEKLNKYYAYDAYSVPPPVPDGEYGQRYPVYRNRATNKLFFYANPGTGNKTIYYRKTFLSDLADWPDEERYKHMLLARTKYHALMATPDWLEQAKIYFQESERLINEEWREQRKGFSLPDSRTPLDVYGNPIYYGLSGDVGGGFWW